jgi:hypothetical protein
MVGAQYLWVVSTEYAACALSGIYNLEIGSYIVGTFVHPCNIIK